MYVDAKITGMHGTALQKKAFVGHVVEGRKDLSGFDQVPASETGETKERAILRNAKSYLLHYCIRLGPRPNGQTQASRDFRGEGAEDFP